MLPHNIEVEQELLGAILINNEAFYRVSDFLEPDHFFETIHQRIFELARSLIRAGKPATPTTLKTFLPGELDIAGLSLNQYLARLVAGATTIINAQDFGQTIYNLSIRRALITIGGDIINLAYDAPVDATPANHIEDAERRLYQIAETGRYDSGFQSFEKALARAVDMTAAAYQRDGKLSGLSTGLRDLDAKLGGLQASDLIILAGRPGMGKRRSQQILPTMSPELGKASIEQTGTWQRSMAALLVFSRSKCPQSNWQLELSQSKPGYRPARCGVAISTIKTLTRLRTR